MSRIRHCKAALSQPLIHLSAANSSMSGPTGGFSGATRPSLDLLQSGLSLYYTLEVLITTQWLSFTAFSFLSSASGSKVWQSFRPSVSAWFLSALFHVRDSSLCFVVRCRRLLTFRSTSSPVRNVSWRCWHFAFVLPLFIFCMESLFFFSGSIGIFNLTSYIYFAIVWCVTLILNFCAGVCI